MLFHTKVKFFRLVRSQYFHGSQFMLLIVNVDGWWCRKKLDPIHRILLICSTWAGSDIHTGACIVPCTLFHVQSGMLEYSTFTCYTWAGSGILTGVSVQLGMLEYNTITCYIWAGSVICKGDCIVICAVRNVGVQYINLLHLSRLWYSHRCLHCSLCSQECWSTIHSHATHQQTLVFAQVTVLFSVQSGMLEYNTFTCYTSADSGIAQVTLLFSVQSGMLEYNTCTCYTWAGSGICTGDYIVLCAVRNAGLQYIHLVHLSDSGIHTGDYIVLWVVVEGPISYSTCLDCYNWKRFDMNFWKFKLLRTPVNFIMLWWGRNIAV